MKFHAPDEIFLATPARTWVIKIYMRLLRAGAVSLLAVLRQAGVVRLTATQFGCLGITECYCIANNQNIIM